MIIDYSNLFNKQKLNLNIKVKIFAYLYSQGQQVAIELASKKSQATNPMIYLVAMSLHKAPIPIPTIAACKTRTQNESKPWKVPTRVTILVGQYRSHLTEFGKYDSIDIFWKKKRKKWNQIYMLLSRRIEVFSFTTKINHCWLFTKKIIFITV